MLRPDIRVEPLRGNVNTRLAKLDNGDYDAIVLAAAGLERLDFGERISQQFTPDQMLPAATQGVIGIECGSNNVALIDVLANLNHNPTAQVTAAERAIAARLQASCQSPVAAYATQDGSQLRLTAMVALPDGSESLRQSLAGDVANAAELGHDLAEQLISAGASELLARAEAMNV